MGNGSGLVEGQEAKLAASFQINAAFDQDAFACSRS